MPSPPRAFVSYSHESPEHEQRVLEAVQELRARGIDARIDLFVQNPPAGWVSWMEHELQIADFVLLVCTPTYRRCFDREPSREVSGRGVTWEAGMIRSHLYQCGGVNDKYIPILVNDSSEEDIPKSLRESTHYRYPENLEKLLRRLTNQPEVVPANLGQVPELPPLPTTGLAQPITSAKARPVELPTPFSLSTERGTPQWTSYRVFDLVGWNLRHIECRIATASPYFRFGLKLSKADGRVFGDGSIQSQDPNVVFHIGRNDWSRPPKGIFAGDLFSAWYANGIRDESDAKLFGTEDNLEATLSVAVDNARVARFTVEGSSRATIPLASGVGERVAVLAWGDTEEYEVDVLEFTFDVE